MFDVRTIREINLTETIKSMDAAQMQSALVKVVKGTEVSQAIEEAQRLVRA